MVKKTFLKEDIYRLKDACKQVGNLIGVKFVYALGKNQDMLEACVREIDRTIKPSKEFSEYDNKRIALCMKHGQKKPDGVPLIVGGKYLGLANNLEFEKEVGDLKDEYKVDVDARDKQIADYDKMLEEEIELDIHMVKLEFVPTNLTAGQMAGVFFMIDDSDGPVEEPKKKKTEE